MDKLIKALYVCIVLRVPVVIWGAPGTGKTQTVISIAKKMMLHLEILIASLREPSDFAGLPVVADGEVRLAPPAWAKRLQTVANGILFLDEITTVNPSVQAPLLRVINERVVGELTLPPTIAIVAAANPPEQAAGGYDLTPPLANRLVHLNFESDPIGWAEGFSNGWPDTPEIAIPEHWDQELLVTKRLIASFIRKQPQLLHVYPKDDTETGKAWPSGRSWEVAAKLFAFARAAELEDEVIEILMEGSVGVGAAGAFLKWVKELDLPNAEDLLADPHYTYPQDRHDKVFAILSGVMTAYNRNKTVTRYHQCQAVFAEAAKQGLADIAYPFAEKLLNSKPDGAARIIAEMSVFSPIVDAVTNAAQYHLATTN